MDDPSQRDLLDAVKESLSRQGYMSKLKAELRSGIVNVLKNGTVNGQPPSPPEETTLINELIREYLLWNGYLYSEKILCDESGQGPEAKMNRDILTTKLGLMDDSNSVKFPLLYYIVSDFLKQTCHEN